MIARSPYYTVTLGSVLRWEGLSQEKAVDHAQKVYNEEKTICEIHEVDRVPVDHKPRLRRRRKLAPVSPLN